MAPWSPIFGSVWSNRASTTSHLKTLAHIQVRIREVFLSADCGNLEKDMCWWKVLRKDFPAIGSSGLTSDQGWGCMLRCGQMVLAGALLDYRLANLWPENRLSISHFTWQVRQRVEVGERPTKWWISGSDGQVGQSCRMSLQNLSANSRFRDIKSAQYSIHQIALMGESVERFRTQSTHSTVGTFL